MDMLLDKIMDFINHNRKIDDEEAEIVRYGLEMAALKITFFVAALAVSLLMNSFWQFIIFISLFSILRSYAGGYHAKTRMRCFIQSMLAYNCGCYDYKYYSKNYIYNNSAVVKCSCGWRSNLADCTCRYKK